MKLISNILLLSVLFLAACVSPSRTALNTVDAVGTTTDAAIGAYYKYTLSNHVNPAHLGAVRRAVQMYVSAADGAKLAAASYQTNQNKGDLDNALQSLSVTAAEVMRVIALSKAPPPLPLPGTNPSVEHP